MTEFQIYHEIELIEYLLAINDIEAALWFTKALASKVINWSLLKFFTLHS